MAQWLKLSTAASIRLGPFIDSTNGVTPASALTIAASTVKLSKGGAAYGALSAACATLVYDSNGFYSVPLAAGDVDTVGRLDMAIKTGSALAVWQNLMVVPAVTYDSLIGGTDYFQVDAIQVGGVVIATSVAQFGTNVVTLATSAITNANFALTAASQVWNAAIRATTGGVVTTNSDKTGYALAASSIAASTLAASAIDSNSFALTAGSQVWNAAVRTTTGGTVTTNSDKTGYGLSASALTEISGSVASASSVWTYATRALTDKINFGLSGSALNEIGASSTTTASAVWTYATRALTDKINFGI